MQLRLGRMRTKEGIKNVDCVKDSNLILSYKSAKTYPAKINSQFNLKNIPEKKSMQALITLQNIRFAQNVKGNGIL